MLLRSRCIRHMCVWRCQMNRRIDTGALVCVCVCVQTISIARSIYGGGSRLPEPKGGFDAECREDINSMFDTHEPKTRLNSLRNAKRASLPINSMLRFCTPDVTLTTVGIFYSGPSGRRNWGNA